MNTIQVEHPEYKRRKAVYRRYRDLYAGGEQIREHATDYLVRRNKEPLEVYDERLSRTFYENYIGSIIDWYAATLFRREPLLEFATSSAGTSAFFGQFADDCDLHGTSLTDFFRGQFVNALTFGCAYTLLDFPRVTQGAWNRAQEDEEGFSRAYVIGYTPEHVINWSHDREGVLEYAVLRSVQTRRIEGQAGWARETTWVEYDRESYRIYRALGDDEPRLEGSGLHALARAGVVPLLEMRLPEGLWLMNKAAAIQLEHFNKSNCLAWAITMGLYAMPVVYSEQPWTEIVGESYFIQMKPNDRFGWAEPEGKVFQIAGDNLSRLKDEIYRTCYLTQQAATSDTTLGQSGLSKLRDFAVTHEVLRGYGDLVKDAIRRVLKAVARAREDVVSIEVSGLDEFDIGDFSSDLEDASRLLALGIASPTLRKQIQKRLAQKYLCDVRQEVKDAISAEIEELSGR